VPGSATITLEMRDSGFVGFTPGCVTVLPTHHGIKDEVDADGHRPQGPRAGQQELQRAAGENGKTTLSRRTSATVRR
jgi:hypothetical protein